MGLEALKSQKLGQNATIISSRHNTNRCLLNSSVECHVYENIEHLTDCKVGTRRVAVEKRYFFVCPLPNHACSFHCTWLSGKSVSDFTSVNAIHSFSSRDDLHVNHHGRYGRGPT